MEEENKMLDTMVDDFLEQHSFSLDNLKIVVGVSGGPDSLALLHYLWNKKEKKNLSIVVAHVDHMFRGEESFQDALFVKEYCELYSIPFEMVQINVPEMMIKTGKSPEVAAREARYAFFAEVMEKYQFPFLALGHHGDDQIETILMRLTRGSTGKARTGIPFSRPFQTGFIFRPFLSITKKEILLYCESHHLIPRIDSSNEKGDYTRNRFRREVLPFLKTENQKVHEHFQRFSEELKSDEEYLHELTVQRMNTVMTKREIHYIIIDIPMFLAMPMPLQRRGIQLILNYLYKERPSSLSAIHIDQIFSLLHHQHPSVSLDFPEKLKVFRSYMQCHFQFGLDEEPAYQFEITKPGKVLIPGNGSLKIENVECSAYESTAFVASFDADEVKWPLCIRTREIGDRMSLKGLSGTKKLKDIFIDCKVPIRKRDKWPVVVDREGTILWLPGLKKSALEGLKKSARNYTQLTYNWNEL